MTLHDDIFLVIGKARRLLEQASRALIDQSGLRLVELDILYFLSHGGSGDTARDIIEAKCLSKAHISKSVDNLRRTGCVTLQEDEADRRCLHLRLTERGQGYARAFSGILQQTYACVTQGVTDEERQAVQTALAKMRRNIDAAQAPHTQPSRREEP